MAIRNSLLGGTDFTDGEVLYDYDLDDTNNMIIESFKQVQIQKYGDSVINGCLVTEQTVPDQTVAVASGKILINGLYYSISADAVVNLSTADATNPRYDLISVNSVGTVTVTDGTPAASNPQVPALPTNEVPLATVYRAANDNVIGTADIADSRRLVDKPFHYTSNTPGSTGSNTYSTIKTITIPAYRCQKHIIIEADYSAYVNDDIQGSTAVSINNQEYLRLDIDDNTGTATTEGAFAVTAVYEIGTSGAYSIFTSTSGVAKIIIDSADYDFTQPITINVSMRGITNWLSQNDFISNNNYLYVRGE